MVTLHEGAVASPDLEDRLNLAACMLACGKPAWLNAASGRSFDGSSACNRWTMSERPRPPNLSSGSLTPAAQGQVDSRQLECFIAVAEELNINRAALRLHMDAAAADQADTEARTRRGSPGFSLADASRDGTHRGRSESCWNVPTASSPCRPAPPSAPARRASGKWATSASATTTRRSLDAIPAILFEFRRQYPDIKVSFELVPGRAQVDYLRDNLLHVGFGRDYPPQPGVVCRPVAAENLYVAVREPSAPGVRPSCHCRRSSRTSPWSCTLRPGRGLRDDVIRMCRSAGFSPVIAVEADDVVARALPPTSRSAKRWPLSPLRPPRPGRTESRSSHWPVYRATRKA